MIPPLKIVCSLLMSYLVGSIPTAYILGRLIKRVDIRQQGSGNVGATNAFRVLGKTAGGVVLIVDVMKGAVAPSVLADFFGVGRVWERVLLGFIAVLGHSFSPFLKFRGGKGVATSLGVLIGLTVKITVLRPILLWAVLIWLSVFVATGFVSLASMVSVTAVPFLMVALNQPLEIVSLGIILCLFVVWRHRSNIHRLLTGKESRVLFLRRKR